MEVVVYVRGVADAYAEHRAAGARILLHRGSGRLLRA